MLHKQLQVNCQLAKTVQAPCCKQHHHKEVTMLPSHPQPSTGPSGWAVTGLTIAVLSSPASFVVGWSGVKISMAWLILMDQVWIPMVWPEWPWSQCGWSVQVSHVQENHTFDVYSMRSENGNFWIQWQKWQCLFKLIWSQIPVNADSSLKDIDFH